MIEILRELNMENIIDNRDIISISVVKEKLYALQETEILAEIPNKPKLRTYNLLKRDSKTEDYVKYTYVKSIRSLIARLRLGVLPIELEVGRFKNVKNDKGQIVKTPANMRFCKVCGERVVEDEIHLLFNCEVYQDVRSIFYKRMSMKDVNFVNLTDIAKLKNLCNTFYKDFGKFLVNIWQIRQDVLFANKFV